MNKRIVDDGSFAYKHMRDQGWDEGQGLGRGNNGEYDPVRINLKNDKAKEGLGHDRAKEFTNQWWDHVFNKAAAKVNVQTKGDGVVVKSEKELSAKKKQKLKHKVLYGNFVKGTTLEQGKETHEEETCEEEVKKPAITILTDEELLKACGGRTAHKGARHGFQMNGKLARVEQQDSQTNSRVNTTSESSSSSSSEDEPEVKHKKKKKKKNIADVEVETSTLPAEKKKKKKSSKKEPDSDDTSDIIPENPKKSKKRSHNNNIDSADTVVTSKKSKKSKRKTDEEIHTVGEGRVTDEDTPEQTDKSKRKKKKKSKASKLEEQPDDGSDNDIEERPKKKKKKKKTQD